MNEYAPAHQQHLTTITTLSTHTHTHTTIHKRQPFCAKARLCCARRAADNAEPHFIPQLFHATRTQSYNPTYYSLMRPNIDACVSTEKRGRRRQRNWESDGSICRLVIMRGAGDNIWVLNWYRLTKYPEQEESAAVLSCPYAMSAPTAPSCTVTIWSTWIQTSSPRPRPKPHLRHSGLESSSAPASRLSINFCCETFHSGV